MTDNLKSDLKAVMDGYTLSEWETEFCDTIMERMKKGWTLTDKQIDTAKAIITKYTIFEGEYYKRRYLPMKEDER